MALYFPEPHTLSARAAAASADELATTHAACAEVRSAFARLKREKRLTGRAHAEAVRAFREEWPYLTRLEVGEALGLAAGELAARHGLKGYDAVHLATALTLAARPEGAALLTYDTRLARAAGAEGLKLWPPLLGVDGA